MSQDQQICSHVLSDDATHIDLVIDAYLQPCDALMSCQTCDARYLIELCDMDGDIWCYRTSAVDPDAYHATLRSLGKGSCDLSRAQAEVFNLRHHATLLPQLLLRRQGMNKEVLDVPAALAVPAQSWPDLPCDGALIQAARKPLP